MKISSGNIYIHLVRSLIFHILKLSNHEGKAMPMETKFKILLLLAEKINISAIGLSSIQLT